MDHANGAVDMTGRVALYRQYDEARQQELEKFAEQFEEMRHRLEVLEADLEDEKETRQSWRKRAQLAENAITRGQFILVLVDGDGYIFKDEYLREAAESGGAMAAHRLATDVQDYLRERNIIDPSSPDVQVMVNVYANRAGLSRHLLDADMIQHPTQLDQFFCSFTQSQALFQFIDCGYGKERADAKLRGIDFPACLLYLHPAMLTLPDTYRFYVYNAQCRYIFLACCHDNGYVAELHKYRHDAIAAPKTILVDSAQMGREYYSLNFPIARLSVFNTQALPIQREVINQPIAKLPPVQPPPPVDDTASQISATETHNGTSSTWSTVTASATTTPLIPTQTPTQPKKPPTKPASTTNTTTSSPALAKLALPNLDNPEPVVAQPGKIPVNRLGQRIDLKMALPTSQELDAFEERIATRKLCNRFHLANDCYTYNCRYDHDPIDAKMKNTLRWKARGIPCANGIQCRDADCFYGHQCPWGREKCTNRGCAFIQKGLHNISDTDVAKHVAAEAY